MGFRNWLGNKLFNIDKVVDEKVRERLNNFNSKEIDTLLVYRESENSVWAKGSADRLLEFYKTTNRMNTFNTETLQFWKWIGGKNAPKLHYPASTSILNSMKSLLFGVEPEIEFKTDDDESREEKKYQELNERMNAIFKDNNLSDFFQKASYMESYSGTIGVKLTLDESITNKPIWQIYPQERLELGTRYGRVVEIRFLDYYNHDKKVYTLKSLYGYGYIDYVLLDDKNEEVPLSTIPELSDLEAIQFDKKIMMAVYKKNRSNNNEFPDSPYGGSDFEGLIDIFHQIDEIYSTMAVYIRNTRPITSITESMLPTTNDGSRVHIPSEWAFDVVKLRKDQDATNVKQEIHRDAPQVKLDQYTDALRELFKLAYQRLGYSNITSNLDGVGANQSGVALQELEKSTLILYQNKVELWRAFIPKLVRLSLVYEDILKTGTIKDDYEDYELSVVFADYHDETFADKVEKFSKAYQAMAIDLSTLHKKTWADELTDDEIMTMTINVKIENGISLTQEEMEFIGQSQQLIDEEVD